MKTFILCFALLFAVGIVRAQGPAHSTIQKLEVSYPLSEQQATGTFVQQQLHLTLNTSADISKINLRIRNRQTGAVVYEVIYTGNATQTDAEGNVLFSRTGNQINITNPTPVELTGYIYELSTENSSGTPSELYTDNQ